MDMIDDAAKIDLFEALYAAWRPVGRSVGVESMAKAAGGPMRVSDLTILVHRQRPRDPFRSRDFDLRRPRAKAPTSKKLSSTEPTRQRSQKKSRRTRV